MNKDNLKEFFKVSNVDISEFINEPIVLSIQILHLYHYILFWYAGDRYKTFKLYDKLLENKEILNSITYLESIPFELCAKYMSLLHSYGAEKRYKNKNIINRIKQIERGNYECRGVYIKDYDNNPLYIIFKFYYDNIIISIDIKTLDIIRYNTIEESIEKICILCNNKFNYELTSIAYTPHYYRANYGS